MPRGQSPVIRIVNLFAGLPPADRQSVLESLKAFSPHLAGAVVVKKKAVAKKPVAAKVAVPVEPVTPVVVGTGAGQPTGLRTPRYPRGERVKPLGSPAGRPDPPPAPATVGE